MASPLFRCKNKIGNYICGNRIYSRNGNRIVVKRHGRSVSFTVHKDEPCEVICEKCGKPTLVLWQENKNE